MTHSQTPHGIEVRHDQPLGSEPEPLILHEIVSDQDISLQVHMVSWLVRLQSV